MNLTLPAAALAVAFAVALPAGAQTPPPGLPPGPPGLPGPSGAAPFGAAPFDPAELPPPPPLPIPWGLHSGDTTPRGDLMLYGEIGWPDVTFGFQRGVGEHMDVGLRVSMLVGVNYITPRDRGGVNDTSLGIGFAVPIRYRIVHNQSVSLLVHADPGIRFDYLDSEPRQGPPYVGPQLPVGIDLGVHVSPRTTITLGLDIPFCFRVTPDPAILIPFLPGVSWERRFTDRFGMSLNLRPGILYGANRTGSSVDFALLSQIGFFGRV